MPCFNLFSHRFVFSPVNRHLVSYYVFVYVPALLWDAVDVLDLTVAETGDHAEELCPQVQSLGGRHG